MVRPGPGNRLIKGNADTSAVISADEMGKTADGMRRLLTPLLLYKADDSAGKYVSTEKVRGDLP